MSPEDIQFWANLATIAAAPLAAVGLFYAGWQIRLGRRATSASAALALSEAFRQAWARYAEAATEEDQTHAFADVVNLLETACTIRNDRLLTGRSGRMVETYLGEVLDLIDDNDRAKSRLAVFMTSATTFSELHQFVRQRKR